MAAGSTDMHKTLRRWFADVDRLLRGDATRPELLAREGGLRVDVQQLLYATTALCMIYGLCMGSFSLLKEVPENLAGVSPRLMQLVASTIKTPLLFLLTLLVTLPSLYVLNALVGSRLRLAGLFDLLVAALAVNAVVLASLGPIVAFFSLTTNSHPFIVLLNVAMFTVAGVLGLIFLLQTLHRLTSIDAVQAARNSPQQPKPDEAAAAPPDQTPSEPQQSAAEQDSTDGALDMPPGQALAGQTRLVFRCWIVLFALVGAQMSWVLRPFIGSPDKEFTWFRERQSNFFTGVLTALGRLLFGD